MAAARLIHEHPRFEKTPIIFVTAVNLSDLDRMRGYRLGAFDYVMVPLIPEILRSKVVALAELYRKRRDLELAHRDLAVAHEELKSEKARELAVLNASLHSANAELARRNAELQIEVTERKRAEERLLEQDRRKDEFLAMLAHELRNPLASIANALAALKLSAIAPHPLHGAMSRQLALLVRLIDDLLDVARIRHFRDRDQVVAALAGRPAGQRASSRRSSAASIRSMYGDCPPMCCCMSIMSACHRCSRTCSTMRPNIPMHTRRSISK